MVRLVEDRDVWRSIAFGEYVESDYKDAYSLLFRCRLLLLFFFFLR